MSIQTKPGPMPPDIARMVIMGQNAAWSAEDGQWLVGDDIDLDDGDDSHLNEGCVPNQTGQGHHDDKTGHPCSPNGSGANQGEKQGHQPTDASGQKPGLGELRQIAGASRDQRWGLANAAAAAWGFVANAPAAIWAGTQAVGKAIYDYLPEQDRKTIDTIAWLGRGVEHALEAGKEAGQRLAVQAAHERGLSDKHVEIVSKAVRFADNFLAWTANIPIVHSVLERRLTHRLQEHAAELSGPVGFLVAKLGFYVPVGSLVYLAASTATNPLATWRAAGKVLTGSDEAARKAMPGHQTHEAEEGPLCGQELMDELLQRMNDAQNPEWYLALWCAALDTEHDSRKAMAKADAALQAHPSGDPSSLASEDFANLIGNYNPPKPYQSQE